MQQGKRESDDGNDSGDDATQFHLGLYICAETGIDRMVNGQMSTLPSHLRLRVARSADLSQGSARQPSVP